MDDSVSPYELLGLIPNKCTLQDVRRAYRELALICHPDKGGNAADMRVLQAAYDWVIRQMTSVKENGTETYEEKESNFKAFLESQVEYKVVSFSDVIKNVTGFTEELFEKFYAKHANNEDPLIKQFVKQYITNYIMFEFGHMKRDANEDNVENAVDAEIQVFFARAQNAQWSYASIPNGYGGVMKESLGSPSHHFGKVEMTIYKEPLTMPEKLGEDIEQLSQLEDYTQAAMCDYRVAYKDTVKPLASLEEQVAGQQTDVQLAFDALQVQRRLDDLTEVPDAAAGRSRDRLQLEDNPRLKSVMLKFAHLKH